jgi:crotonobetainyl-CoA:carnitine CoA-transferase CaiB-like acyl-CoA transferase
VRVIDTCIVLAGPTVGRLLAEFGAEVIKIDSPRRPMIERAWLDVNRGKHSVLLDLETEQGTAILAEMLGSADVFLQNFRPGVIERLGFGYDAVAATHPELIYGSFNAYGWDGPLSNLPGWEQYAQAISGIQVRNGARGGTPRTTTFTINDYGTGVAGALGIAAALYERRHTGKGRHVRGSLTATAGFHQALYMVDFAGHAREEIEGTKAVGWSALSRLYRCSDHPAYLQATVGDLGALSACNGLADLPIEGDDLGPESDLAMELERRFGEADAATWERRLRGIGVGFARARTIPEFVTDPEARRLGHLASRVVPGYGRVDTVGSCSRFDGSRPPVPIAAMPGADTVRVLRDLEIDEQRIADLFEAGVLQSCAEGIVPQQTETAGV